MSPSPSRNLPRSLPRPLPLTLLATPGPLARAYLVLLRRAGYRVARVLLAVPGRSTSGWLSSRVRRHRAEASGMYWPRRLRVGRPDLYRGIVDGLAGLIEDPGDLMDEMLGPFRWRIYADSVSALPIAGFADPALAAKLMESKHAVLYAGSRILPGKLLDAGGLRFLHVHPGVLPEVRGADGMLWSILLRGKLGMSAFYLAPEIDTGAVIATAEYDVPSLALPRAAPAGGETLYRALFSFVDPLLRAQFLVSHVLPRGEDWRALPSAPQNLAEGRTYTFMPKSLWPSAFAPLFGAGPRVRNTGMAGL